MCVWVEVVERGMMGIQRVAVSSADGSVGYG